MTNSRPLARARSFLFVPGNRPDRFPKAAAAGADSIVIDLEDAIDPASKVMAREEAARWVSANPSTVVRVNAVGSEWFDDDLSALSAAAVAVLLPKAESLDDVALVLERLPTGSVVIPIVETASAIVAARSLLAAPGVVRAAFGSIDLSTELGVDPDDRTAMHYARSTLVFASAAAGIAPPLDGVTTSISEQNTIASDAAYAKRLGFGGKLCIHPVQVQAVHAAFRPSVDDLEWARRTIDIARTGNAVAVDGRMVDRPVVVRARNILALSAELARGDVS